MEIQSKEILASHFEKMGATAEIIDLDSLSDREKKRNNFSNSSFNINVRNGKKGEHFVVSVSGDIMVTVPNVAKEARHLLLNVSRKDKRNMITNEKYLCGHDERHWFVASVPGNQGITTVKKAMDALKPKIAETSQKTSGVRKKDIHKRHNKGYKRQGEWFFVPTPFTPDENFTFHNEPIRRGRGKEHMCETLCRKGGVPVMVCSLFGNGLTIPEYEKWIKENPNKSYLRWNNMTRDAQVFVTGKIIHPDHKTLELIGWHLVVPNTESKATQFTGMAFLD